MTNAKNLQALMDTVNFNASLLIGALAEFDMAGATLASANKATVQSMVDAATKAGVKKEQGAVEWFGRTIRECEAFVDAVAEGMIEKKTVTEYAQGAMRAFYHGTEWTPRTKNDPAMALPWGKAKAPGAKVSTAVGENASAGAKVVNVATNLAALAYFVPNGYVLPLLAAMMALSNVSGSLAGTWLALKYGSGFIRRVFLLVVGVLILKFAWDTLQLFH